MPHSGHADKDDFLAYLSPLAGKVGKVRLIHGEREQADALAQTLDLSKQTLLYQAETDEERKAATEETYARKIRELRYAIAFEKNHTKDWILERYLNIAYFGDGAFGVQSAARHFFSKNAKDLNLLESATLAGLVDLRPALSLSSEVSFVKRVVAGEGISYGLRHHIARDTILATVPIGYAIGGIGGALGGLGGNMVQANAVISLRIIDTTTAERLVSVSADGEVKKPTYELLAIAKRIGSPSAVFIGGADKAAAAADAFDQHAGWSAALSFLAVLQRTQCQPQLSARGRVSGCVRVCGILSTAELRR